MKFVPLFAKFWRLLDGHVTLAIMAPIVAFGGWVPMLLNLSSRGVVAWSLPNVVGMIQMIAMLGILVTVFISLRMLPQRPDGLKRSKFAMVVQWVLSPVIAIAYQSVAAFYAQTRLMTGKYMEKFDVTKKIVKH